MKLFYWNDTILWKDMIIESNVALSIDVAVMLHGYWNNEDITYLEAY